MDELAWNRKEATLWVGITFFAAGTIAIFTFAMTEAIEKRYSMVVV